MLSEKLPDDPAQQLHFRLLYTQICTNKPQLSYTLLFYLTQIDTNKPQPVSLTHIHPQPHYSIRTLTDTYARNKPSTHREENNTLHKKARAGNNLQKKHRYNEVAYSTDKKKFNIREAITYCQWFQMRSRCCAPLLCAFQSSIRPRYFTQTCASCLF